MKKFAIVLSMIVSTILLLLACGDTEDSTPPPPLGPPPEFGFNDIEAGTITQLVLTAPKTGNICLVSDPSPVCLANNVDVTDQVLALTFEDKANAADPVDIPFSAEYTTIGDDYGVITITLTTPQSAAENDVFEATIKEDTITVNNRTIPNVEHTAFQTVGPLIKPTLSGTLNINANNEIYSGNVFFLEVAVSEDFDPITSAADLLTNAKNATLADDQKIVVKYYDGVSGGDALTAIIDVIRYRRSSGGNLVVEFHKSFGVDPVKLDNPGVAYVSISIPAGILQDKSKNKNEATTIKATEIANNDPPVFYVLPHLTSYGGILTMYASKAVEFPGGDPDEFATGVKLIRNLGLPNEHLYNIGAGGHPNDIFTEGAFFYNDALFPVDTTQNPYVYTTVIIDTAAAIGTSSTKAATNQIIKFLIEFYEPPQDTYTYTLHIPAGVVEDQGDENRDNKQKNAAQEIRINFQ